jgi:hypothetical protein
MENKCIKCKEKKDVSLFYKHSQMAKGILNKCIECCKNDQKKRTSNLSGNKEWKSKEKERGRLKYHRLYKGVKVDKVIKKNAIKNYANNYPEKTIAKNKSSHLKSINGNNHHWSYNIKDAKDVIDLTKDDHYLLHRHIIYDQERMMYRRADNNILLDSKQSHIDLLNEIKKH